MSVAGVLDEALREGIYLYVDDDKLKYVAARNALSSELKTKLATYKEKIIDHLAREAARSGTASYRSADIPPRDAESAGPLPLSFGQRRLWFFHQYTGPNPIYNMPLALRLHGEVNEAALVRSLEELYRRHEALRTRFEGSDDDAVQVIDPPELELDVEPVSAVDVEAIAHSERFHHFDLSSERLCRIRLLRESDREPGDYLLLVTMHHSVSDAWSIGIFFHELVSLYRAYANGECSPLAPLPIQYADYALWQRRWLRGAVLEEQMSYWREQLKGLPLLLTLPTDRPRPSEQTYRGRTEHFALPLALTERLQVFSREQGVTLYMTLLSAFAVLLSRYAGQRDIAVGTPIANRTRPETEGLIGFFVNTLVMRHDLSGDPPFTDLLERTRTTALQAYAHQDVPFEKLVEELNPQRSVSHSPLFQVMFILQNAPFEGFELPGLELRSLVANETKGDREAVQEGAARFDLTLSVQESSSGLVGGFEYNTDLFERSTIRRMLDHYSRLLEAILTAPRARLSRLEMLGGEERHQQLVEWNATARSYPDDKCIHELFEERAEQTPDRIALVHEGDELTYGELNRRANALAHQLIEQGVGPEVRVGLCMPRSPEMVIGLLGILKAGGCYVPLDPNYPRKRLDYLIEDSGVDLIVDHRMVTQSHPCAGATGNPVTSVNPANLAYVIYTSGSTGRPKGVEIAHRSAVSLLSWSAQQWPAREREGVLASTSICFDLSIYELFLPLTQGGECLLIDSILGLSEMAQRERVSLINTVPSAAKALLEKGGLPQSLRVMNLAGEPLKAELADKLYESSAASCIYDLYGPSESTTYSTHALRSANGRETIGRPVANTQAYVLDGHGELLPSGVTGDLYLGGVGLSRGYLNQPASTAEKFIPNRFSEKPGERLYRTGDLARWLPDGTLEYLGRVDHQVKVRGYRIELGEIESMLLAHEGVRDAVVVARDDDAGNKRLVGYVVAEAAAPSDETTLVNELRSRLQEQLPHYMVPSALVVLPDLPLTANGKVDRKALLGLSIQTQQESFVPPATQVERWLCEIWQAVLGIERIGVEDNFFAGGGDSILSIQVVSRAKERGLRLTVRDLFKHPTVAALARQIDLAQVQEAPQLQEQQASAGEMPLLPIHRRLFESGAPRPQHYHQSQLLSVPEGFSLEFLRSFVTALYHRHDALRLRYRREGEQWQGHFAPVGEALISKTVTRETLQGASEESREAQRLSSAQAVKAGFDLQQGPLFKAVYYDTGRVEDSSLLLVLHHLIVDGVSWRVLLHDLSQAFEQWRAGGALELAPKTTSYQQWAGMLLEYVNSVTVREERDYWIGQLSQPVPPLPLDHESEATVTAEEMTRTIVALDQEETEVLLTRCVQVYRAQVQELLLAGLLLAFHDWTGQRRLRVNVEGHGREEGVFAGVDLSETVGWFTSLYPVYLELAEGSEREETLLVETIKRVKEQLRGVPQHGLNYGVLRYLARDEELERLERAHRAPVLFNYLGQFDQQLGKGAMFAPTRGDTGPDVDATHPREHLLDFNGAVSGGCLHFALDYDPCRLRRKTAEQLGSRYMQALRRIVRHSQAPRIAAFTPSDFPLAFRALERT